MIEAPRFVTYQSAEAGSKLLRTRLFLRRLKVGLVRAVVFPITGIRIIIEFFWAMFGARFMKRDVRQIATNAVIRVALTIGLMTTVLAAVQMLRLRFPLGLTLFVIYQAYRVCYFVGSDVQATNENFTRTPNIEDDDFNPEAEGEEEDNQTHSRYVDQYIWRGKRYEWKRERPL